MAGMADADAGPVPTLRLLVVGEGPVSDTLGAVAVAAGWHADVVGTLPEAQEALPAADAVVVTSHDDDVDAPAIRAAQAPREIARDAAGATYASALTVSGRDRLRISVAMAGTAAPQVLVRSGGRAFQPLVAGGPAVVIADPAADAPPTVIVEYRVHGAAAGTRAERASLTYTVWTAGH